MEIKKKSGYQKVLGGSEDEPFDNIQQDYNEDYSDDDDNDDDIIPASAYFPERRNILKEGQFINFGDNLDDPCATIFAIRVNGYRINIQRCECFQLFLGLILLSFFCVVILIEIFQRKK